MSIRADELYRESLNRLNAVGGLLDAGKLEEAARHAGKVLRFAESHGIVSAHLCWVLAVVYDNRAAQSNDAEHFEKALSWIRRAVETDPLAVPFWKSYHVVVDRARAAILDPAREASDPAKERLYKALLNMDEGMPEVHIAYARYLLACERAFEAVTLLSSLTRLHPPNKEAWTLLAQAAAAIGDFALAVEAEAHAGEGWTTPEPRLRLLPLAKA